MPRACRTLLIGSTDTLPFMRLHRLAASLALVLSASILTTLAACGDPAGLTSNSTSRVTIGDTVTATIEAGGEPRTFTFEANAGDTLALFLHATSGAVSLVVIAPDASTLAALADAARQGALEDRGAGPFAIDDAGTYVVRATAVGSAATSFRFRLLSVEPAPEHQEGPITIGDTIRGVHDTPADIDEFTFQGQEGDELIGYIRSLAPERRSVISMLLSRTGGEPVVNGLVVATSDTVTHLEAHPTGRFTLPATGQYTVRIWIQSRVGGGPVAEYPRSYEFQVRRIVRTPETALGVIAPGDTVSAEAIDYVGDIDELTIAAPNGGEFNLFLERPGTGPGSLTVIVLDVSAELVAAGAHPPGVPLHATATGTFTISPSTTARIRVQADDGEYAYRGAYRIFVYPVNRAPESAGSSLVIGDSVTSETIELAGDLDEFTLTVPTTTLANFVVWRDADLAPDVVRLQLFGSGGEQTTITESYRGAPGEKTGAATGTFNLPAGTYTLRIGGSDSRGTGYRGPYRVQTLPIDPAPEAGPSTLAFGDTVVDAVEPLGDIDRFTFSGRAGQHVGVRVESAGSQPVLTYAGVKNARTNEWLDQDWYGGTGTPRYDLPEDGEYVIEYQAANAGRSVSERGPYRLIFDTVSTATETHGRAISPGDSVVDESLDFIGDIDRFVLSGAPGEELTVTFIAPPGGWGYIDLIDLDTGLRVDGTPSAGWLQNTGRFVLPTSGQLGIRVWTRDNSQFLGLTGLYRFEVLSIDRSPESVSAHIEIDSVIDGEAIDPEPDVDEFTFNGVAGNTVEVYFQTPLGIGFEGLVLELINPATGAVLGSVSSNNPTEQLDEQGTGPVVLPSTGSYMVRVRSNSDSVGKGQYRLQVKSLP